MADDDLRRLEREARAHPDDPAARDRALAAYARAGKVAPEELSGARRRQATTDALEALERAARAIDEPFRRLALVEVARGWAAVEPDGVETRLQAALPGATRLPPGREALRWVEAAARQQAACVRGRLHGDAARCERELLDALGGFLSNPRAPGAPADQPWLLRTLAAAPLPADRRAALAARAWAEGFSPRGRLAAAVAQGGAATIVQLGLGERAAADVRALDAREVSFPFERLQALSLLGAATADDAGRALEASVAGGGGASWASALDEFAVAPADQAFALAPGHPIVRAALDDGGPLDAPLDLPTGRLAPPEAAWLRFVAAQRRLAGTGDDAARARPLVEGLVQRVLALPAATSSALGGGLRMRLQCRAAGLVAGAPLPAAERAALLRRVTEVEAPGADPYAASELLQVAAAGAARLGADGASLLDQALRSGLAALRAGRAAEPPRRRGQGQPWWVLFEALGAVAAAAGRLGDPARLEPFVAAVAAEADAARPTSGGRAEAWEFFAARALVAAGGAARALGDGERGRSWLEAGLSRLAGPRPIDALDALDLARDAIDVAGETTGAWRAEGLRAAATALAGVGLRGELAGQTLALDLLPRIVDLLEP